MQFEIEEITQFYEVVHKYWHVEEVGYKSHGRAELPSLESRVWLSWFQCFFLKFKSLGFILINFKT